MSEADWVPPNDEGWIRTLSGGRFYPLAPRIEDVKITDLAHALAVKCRYGGHCKGFYSVAQHCCLVADDLYDTFSGGHPNYRREMALAGLLHDSDEAYSPFGDIPRPVKRQMEKINPGFGAYIKLIGDHIRDTVYERYNLPPGEPAAVKRVDDAILWDERRAFMTGDLTLMPTSEKGLRINITQWSWERSENEFLHRYFEYTTRTS